MRCLSRIFVFLCQCPTPVPFPTRRGGARRPPGMVRFACQLFENETIPSASPKQSTRVPRMWDTRGLSLRAPGRLLFADEGCDLVCGGSVLSGRRNGSTGLSQSGVSVGLEARSPNPGILFTCSHEPSDGSPSTRRSSVSAWRRRTPSAAHAAKRKRRRYILFYPRRRATHALVEVRSIVSGPRHGRERKGESKGCGGKQQRVLVSEWLEETQTGPPLFCERRRTKKKPRRSEDSLFVGEPSFSGPDKERSFSSSGIACKCHVLGDLVAQVPLSLHSKSSGALPTIAPSRAGGVIRTISPTQVHIPGELF
mmetsp:Transcript_42550/g.109400  ORF Transcript_42550/g.109400 Transcript_42550/m.109400 type:complete len:310 (+) Transcript_42550:1033-1962(+)